jgi:hypothetical protein
MRCPGVVEVLHLDRSRHPRIRHERKGKAGAPRRAETSPQTSTLSVRPFA